MFVMILKVILLGFIFIMSDKYNVTLSKQERKMMEVWNKLDPVDEWERIKNRRVVKLQGNLNKYVISIIL